MFITADNIHELSDAALEVGVVAGIEAFIREQTKRDLARRVAPMAKSVLVKYSENQPRDDHGRFGEGGGETFTSTKDISDHFATKYGVNSYITENSDKIYLDKVVVPPTARGEGVGTKFMNALTGYADQKGLRIDLTPSKDFGASSVSRLTDFYKGFGFVENTGRNADYSISAAMYRMPKSDKSVLVKYSEDQPRDDHGRFGSGGSSDTASALPTHTDLSGHRLDSTKRAELSDKSNHLEEARWAAMERITGEPNWRNVTAEQRAEIEKQPEVVAARNALQNDPLYKFIAEQPAFNEDKTLGPKTIGQLDRANDPETPIDHFVRLGAMDFDSPNRSADYSTPEKVYLKDSNGNYVLDANGRPSVQEVSLTKEEAVSTARAATSAYLAEATPTFVCSNKALSSILASDEVKTYVNADRPSRAGITDVGYMNRRATYEAAAFGYKTTDSVRPISTFITDDSRYVHPELLDAYGGTRVVLKDDVKDRTTVTANDSLNYFASPTPYNQYGDSIGAVRAKGIAGDAVAGVPMNVALSGLEAQVHGGISTSDIAKVVFQDKAPVAVSAKLDKLGIPYEVKPKVVQN